MLPFTKIKFNIPNALSSVRFILTPPLLVILATTHYPDKTEGITLRGLLILFVFFLIVLSDIADGIAARKLNIESEPGKQFDILADFFYRILLLSYFCIAGEIHYLFLIIFTFVFLLFISGYTPFKMFKSVKAFSYSGKSLPVSVTIMIGMLLLNEITPDIYFFHIITLFLKYAVYLLSLIVLITKIFFYEENPWKMVKHS